jgi:membrane protein YdbS with pleckstrin-like domain
MEKINKNIFPIVLVITGSFCLLTIVCYSYYSPLWGDDFEMIMAAKSNSIFAIIKYFYLHWDGRICTLQGIVEMFLFKYDYKLMVYFYSICFILCCLLIIKIINTEIPAFQNRKRVTQFILGSLLTVLLWHGIRYNIAQVVYWSTGGGYILLALFMFLNLFITLIYVKNSKNSKSNIVLLTVTGLISGMGSFNATIGLITLYIFDFLYNKTYSIRKIYLISIISNLIGLIFVVTAPGNLVRAHSGGFTPDIIVLFKNYLLILENYFKWSVPVIVGACLIASIFYFFNYINNNKKAISKNEFICNNFKNLKWILATLSTVLLFAFIPKLASSRTAIFFMLFLFIFVHLSVTNLLFFLHNQLVPFLNLIKKYYWFIPLFFFIYHFHVIAQHIQKASLFKKQLEKRYEYFYSHKNQNISVAPLNPDLPFTIRWYDLSTDSTDHPNMVVAKYFNLKSIKTIE